MKYVLVTGAFGGMGAATARALAASGYFVFALDRRCADAAESIMPIEADITSEESIRDALCRVKEITSELFAIIHFAGTYMMDSLAEMPTDKFELAFDINVFGAFRVNKIFLPLLRPGSRIVITTSELAPLDPLPFTGIYAITKSALEKYAFSLRMELQLLGISVAVIRPGAVRTGMLGDSTAALDSFCERTAIYSCNARRFKKIVESVEARNVPPERIAKAALKALAAKHPKYVYKLNRNPLLLMLNSLPPQLQTWIIKKVLK